MCLLMSLYSFVGISAGGWYHYVHIFSEQGVSSTNWETLLHKLASSSVMRLILLNVCKHVSYSFDSDCFCLSDLP
ncbi:hypothetical protein F7725_011994 [Dissostichus mawsoni]|uniref:Uncharacterized protein n=1 Tax=Dissostichus mawsoni TaxID=36200 RepID=A0A7J5ZB59_DISMA|nr:hypothetical protein F7725_011994 [Dissostichus mawsoni]